MGTTYDFDGEISVVPPLNYAEIKTATKTALGLVSPHHKKHATEENVFVQYMPLAPKLQRTQKDTDEGPLEIVKCSAFMAPTENHYLPIRMVDLVRVLMRRLPGHQWSGTVVAIRSDGMVGYKLTAQGADGNPATVPGEVAEIKGVAHMVWENVLVVDTLRGVRGVAHMVWENEPGKSCPITNF